MKNILVALISVFMLVIFQGNSFSQERDSLIQIHPAIGDTLKVFDSYFFDLYTFGGFVSAVYYIRDNKFFVSKVNCTVNGESADTIIVSPLDTLNKIRSRIEQIEIENNKKAESPYKAIITLKSGVKYKGILNMFNENYLYLVTDNEIYSSPLSFKVNLADVDQIVVMGGEPDVLLPTFLGGFIGTILGVIIAGASESDFFPSEFQATVGGFLGGILGGIVGLFAGLTSSPDEVLIQYNSQKDLIKLKNYAKYYFIYDVEIEKRYHHEVN